MLFWISCSIDLMVLPMLNSFGWFALNISLNQESTVSWIKFRWVQLTRNYGQVSVIDCDSMANAIPAGRLVFVCSISR
jgi:hypothetical protein